MSLVALLLAMVFLVLAAALGLHCLVLHGDSQPRDAKRNREPWSRSR
jgi:hypothetical protein